MYCYPVSTCIYVWIQIAGWSVGTCSRPWERRCGRHSDYLQYCGLQRVEEDVFSLCMLSLVCCVTPDFGDALKAQRYSNPKRGAIRAGSGGSPPRREDPNISKVLTRSYIYTTCAKRRCKDTAVHRFPSSSSFRVALELQLFAPCESFSKQKHTESTHGDARHTHARWLHYLLVDAPRSVDVSYNLWGVCCCCRLTRQGHLLLLALLKQAKEKEREIRIGVMSASYCHERRPKTFPRSGHPRS